MDMDTVLLLLLTLLGHSTVAYGTVWYIFKRKSQELAEFAKPEKLVPILIGVMNYRKPPEPGQEGESQTMLEALCGYLGASLGRYISGMLGRASRDVNNAALDAAAAANPTIAAILSQPGAKKLLKNPIVASIVQPLIEAAVKGATGYIQGAQPK